MARPSTQRFICVTFLAAACCKAVAVPISKSACAEEFEHWKAHHRMSYGSSMEHRRRLKNFCTSLKEIDAINSRSGMTWRAATNPYSDLTWEEFAAAKLMAAQNCSATHETPVHKLVDIKSPAALPLEWDWRNQSCGETSCVSMVKNQGHCGSCWTFSTVGMMESLHAIKTGKMVLFAEQQLIDCAANFNNHGCNGGLPSQAFEYIRYNGGLSKMDEYPYVCGGGTCNETGGKVGLWQYVG